MFSPGQTIFDGITVIRCCGGGAYGEVYYCHDTSGKPLALKIISKMRLGSQWQRELKGITNYRKLAENTPGLLRLYNVNQNDDSLYYTMEPADAAPGGKGYVPDTLAYRLSAGPLPQRDLLPVLSSILESIVAIHDAGFAHRDIKPENILFVRGRPTLADLGLLSPLTGSLTQLAGTLNFIPPESRQADVPGSRNSRKSRQQNDIYAFGKIIYCCITGNNASQFPHLPEDFATSLPANRLLNSLTNQLCARQPALRLTSLPAIASELARIAMICKEGATIRDQLHYCCLSGGRLFKSLCLRPIFAMRSHWLTTAFVTISMGFAIASLVGHVQDGADSTTAELAAAIRLSRKNAQMDAAGQKRFAFGDGRYSVAIPPGWRSFGRNEISGARMQPPMPIHGLLTPANADSASSVIALEIIPLTARAFIHRPPAGIAGMLKPYLGKDLDITSVRQYRDPRHNAQVVQILGRLATNHRALCYVYPGASHTLAIMALMTPAHASRDLGIFLAVNDSLQLAPAAD